MPKIPLEQAQPGQKLARAIRNSNGIVMIQPGTELTPVLIQRLKSLGMDTIIIVGEGGGTDKPIDVALEQLEARFAGHERDPWMMELKGIVRRQLEEAAQSHG